jgi:hypothetical protein
LEFVNEAAFGIGAGGLAGEDNIPLMVDTWVALFGVDKFSMPASMFLHKDRCDLMTGVEASSKLAGVRNDGTWCRHEFDVLSRGEVDWELEFAADRDETAVYIGAGY